MTTRTLLAALLAAAATGCVLEVPDEPIAPKARPRTVTVTPGSGIIPFDRGLQLVTTVEGDGPVPQTVAWSVDDLQNCQCGVDKRGVLWADIRMDSLDVVVKATSSVAGEVFDVGTYTILPPAIHVAPLPGSLAPGETVQLLAEVQGVVDQAVVWKAQSGTIDAQGRYTAPLHPRWETDQVVATSPVIGGLLHYPYTAVEGVGSVALEPAIPVLTGAVGPARPGDQVSISGVDLEAIQSWTNPRVAFQGAVGGAVTTTFFLVDDGAGGWLAVATVPQGAVDGAVRLVGSWSWSNRAVESNAIPFRRVTELRVRPERLELAAGETARIRVAFLEGSDATPLELSSDVGTLSGDLFTGPSGASLPARANVRVCAAGSSSCAGATIALRPFRVEPSPAVLPPGGAVALQAVGGAGALPATFTLLAGPGSITPDGHYAAPADPLAAGSALVRIQAAGAERQVEVVVTGRNPGVVARVAEEIDPAPGPIQTGAAWGTWTGAVAAGGGRIYAAATPVAGGTQPWIDVFDAADPVHPAWLGAVAARASVSAMRVTYGRLYALETDGNAEAFDLSGALPVLLDRTALPSLPSYLPIYAETTAALEDDALYLWGQFDRGRQAMLLTTYHFADGPLVPSPVYLPLPPDGYTSTEYPARNPVAGGGKAYLSYLGTAGTQIAAYDLSTSPPALAWTLAGLVSSAPLHLQGPILVASWGNTCVDTRSPGAGWIQCPILPGAMNGTRGVASYAGDLQVLDVADPLAPIVTGLLPDGNGLGVWTDGLYVEGQGSGGLVLHDLRPPGGPRYGAPRRYPTQIYAAAAVVARGDVLYAGGQDQSGASRGVLEAVDLRSDPPVVAWSELTPAVTVTYGAPVGVTALSLAGDLLLAGTPEALRVQDVTAPLAPVTVATVPMAVAALAGDGPVHFAGTFDGQLVALDLSMPSAPLELARIQLDGPVRALALLGPGLLGAATGTATAPGSLLILDVSAPAAPQLVGTLPLGAPACALAVDGGQALVLTGASLLLPDLTDPAAPLVRAAVPLSSVESDWDPCASRSLAALFGLAWVGWGVPYAPGSGTTTPVRQAYDLTRPDWPRLVAQQAGNGQLVLDGPAAWTMSTYSWGTVELRELLLDQPRNVLLAPVRAP